jgi:hypothetical protein
MILSEYGSCANVLYHILVLRSPQIIYREALHVDHISKILLYLPKWREERLSPPRVSQSEVSCVFVPSWSSILILSTSTTKLD